MVYVKDNKIFYINEVRKLFPNTSIPDDANLDEFGFTKLIYTTPPSVLPWHRIDQGDPVDNTQTWIQVPLTETEIIDQCNALLNEKLDTFAKERGYDNVLSACSYATSTVPKFQLEGQTCVRLRDECWNCLFSIISDVRDGIREMPTWEQIETELPALVWPE